MFFRQINDPKLAQYAYLIGCQQTGEALIIDPERDVDRYLQAAADEGLKIVAVAETHIHADFLSGARELAESHGAHLYLSAEGGEDWQYEWAKAGADRARGYAVTFLEDGSAFDIGKIHIQAIHTPGHTPEHMSFLVTDRGGGADEPMGIASGDFVFVGDLGRPDLLESAAGIVGMQDPSARALYRSVGRFLDLPEHIQIWPAHGAGSACGKALGAVPVSTVGYEKRFNGAIDAARRGEEAFVEAILAGQPEPPLYFATMKRLNREGPAILGELPNPPLLTASELAAVTSDEMTVVVDTRTDRRAFMARHLKGSLFAPLNRTFSTIVGSYLRPEERIVLLAEKDQLDEAVRDLVRIGYDHIVGYAPPNHLESTDLLGRLRQTPVIELDEAATLAERSEFHPIDVRGALEHAAGHVPGALNIAHTRLRDHLDELPADGELLVYCASGNRAAAATALLQREGYKVRYVEDDFARWRTRRTA